MLIKIGHRGACGYAPENTLLSFQKALPLNLDFIEFDVQKCKSGEIVVIHDITIDRTTNGKGFIFERTLDEIKSLNIIENQKIPTLEEVLNLVNKKTKLNIELKAEGTAEPVTDIINTYIKKHKWNYNHFLVSSFNQYELKKFNKLIPQIKIGINIDGIPLGYTKFTKKLNVYSIHLAKDFVNKKIVDDAHKRGLKVFVYTIDTRYEAQYFEKLGVDGVFSNYPDKV